MLNSGKHQPMVEAVSTLSVKELMANQDDSDRRSDYSLDQSVTPPPAYSRGSGVTATTKLMMATVIVVSVILGACIVAAAYAARQSTCHCGNPGEGLPAEAAFATFDRLSVAPTEPKNEEILIVANEVPAVSTEDPTTTSSGLVEADKEKQKEEPVAQKESDDSSEEPKGNKKKKNKSRKNKKNKNRRNKNRRGNHNKPSDDDEDNDSDSGPVIFHLDDLARTILEHEERAMMNCVLEKRRQPTFLPFEAQRSLKVFCRGGRDEPFGPVVAIASSFDKDEGEMPMRMRPMMSPAAMLARTFFQPPRRLPMSPKRPMGGVRVLPPFLIPMKLDEKEGPGPNLDSLESAVMKALGPLEFILNEEVLGPRPEFNTRKPSDEEDAKHRQNSDEVPLPFEVESPVGPHEKNKPFPAPVSSRPNFGGSDVGPLARLAHRPGFLAGLFPPPPPPPPGSPAAARLQHSREEAAEVNHPLFPMMDDNNNEEHNNNNHHHNNKPGFAVQEMHHHRTHDNGDEESEQEQVVSVHHVRRGMLPMFDDADDDDEEEEHSHQGPSNVMRPPDLPMRAARFLQHDDEWNSEPSTPFSPHFIQPRSLRRRGPMAHRHL